MKDKPNTLMTQAEVCNRLHVSRSTLHKIRREDKTFPPPVRIYRRSLRWTPAGVEEWIAKQTGAAGQTGAGA